MQKVKIKSGSWAGNTAKIIGSSNDSNLLLQLFSSHKRITVKRVDVELIQKEATVLPSRAIGALDFTNPYTEQD